MAFHAQRAAHWFGVAVIAILSQSCWTVLSHGSFHIVATGDSITTGLAPNRLQSAMLAQGLSRVTSAQAYSVASGGATSDTYLGLANDSNGNPPRFHNFAWEALNGPVDAFGSYPLPQVLTPEPDAVVVMIGTNDAMRAATNPPLEANYLSNLATIATYLQSATTPAGKEPKVFIATLLPILEHPSNSVYLAANQIIDDVFNPAIRQAALDYGFQLLDLNQSIQAQPNWQDWYSDDGQTPGYVHLWANGGAGYQWLASEVLYGVLDTYAGDTNLDGENNIRDLQPLLTNYFSPQNRGWADGDFNHDGKVDGWDKQIWFDHLPPAEAARYLQSIPEPATVKLGLWALGTWLGNIAYARWTRRAGRCRFQQPARF